MSISIQCVSDSFILGDRKTIQELNSGSGANSWYRVFYWFLGIYGGLQFVFALLLRIPWFRMQADKCQNFYVIQFIKWVHQVLCYIKHLIPIHSSINSLCKTSFIQLISWVSAEYMNFIVWLFSGKILCGTRHVWENPWLLSVSIQLHQSVILLRIANWNYAIWYLWVLLGWYFLSFKKWHFLLPSWWNMKGVWKWHRDMLILMVVSTMT